MRLKDKFLLKTFFILSLWIGITILTSCQQRPGKEREHPPNVLMISVDDLNDWIGAMGGHPNAITPNIDKLASEGVLFTNAHAQAPLCGPSRASILSGQRPSTTGIYGQIRDEHLRSAAPQMDSLKFLPEYFAAHGYKTMGIGKIFHDHAPEGVFHVSAGRNGGFGPKPDTPFHWDKDGTSTDWGAYPDTDEKMPDYQSAKWTMERLKEQHDKPFFLALGFFRPHVPLYVPQKWFDKHPIDQVSLPPYLESDLDDIPPIGLAVQEMPVMPTTEWAIENDQWKNITQAYLASISFVDHYIGEVLAALEKSRYADNTVVILWSDHGYRVGEKGTFAKHCLWQVGTNAPLIIKTPNAEKGVARDASVELLDIYPTLLEVCGLPENPHNEGRSLVPLLHGKTSTWPERSAITTYGQNNHSAVSRTHRYIRYEDGSEELYDRTIDPEEWNNIAKVAKYDRLKKELASHFPSVNVAPSSRTFMRNNEYFRKRMPKTQLNR